MNRSIFVNEVAGVININSIFGFGALINGYNIFDYASLTNHGLIKISQIMGDAFINFGDVTISSTDQIIGEALGSDFSGTFNLSP